MPTVSIIIPVHNSEKYLQKCIESVLRQTLSDFELILVDDGSTDSSLMICNQYAKIDNRIRVFHKNNSGVSSARNLGLDNTSGRFVCFIDSDDIVEAHYLDNFFECGDKYDIFFQGYRKCHNGEEQEVGVSKPIATNEFIDSALCELYEKKMFGWSWNKLFLVSIIEKYNVRFDDTISLREDELFTLQYCKHVSSIYISPKSGYLFFYHDSSLMNKTKDPMCYLKVNELLHSAAAFYHNTELRWIEYSRYIAENINAMKWMYSCGKIDGYNFITRKQIIEVFTHGQKVPEAIKSFFQDKAIRYAYLLLWHTKSPRLIDLILQLSFNTFYGLR